MQKWYSAWKNINKHMVLRLLWLVWVPKCSYIIQIILAPLILHNLNISIYNFTYSSTSICPLQQHRSAAKCKLSFYTPPGDTKNKFWNNRNQKKYKKRTLKTNSHWKCSKYVVRHLGRPPPSPQIYASQSRKWRWRQTNIFSKWFQAFHPPTCIHLRVSMADCNCFSYGCVSDRKRTVCVCVCVCDIYMYIYIYRYRYVCVCLQ